MSTEHPNDPPRSSTAVVATVTLLAVALFFREVSGVLLPAAVGIVGGLCLTASLRIVASGTDPVHRLVTSLLSVPVAAGFVVGVFGTGLILTGAFFPVQDASDVSVATLLVAGNLGVVVGSGLAVFGVTLGAKQVVAARALGEYTRTAFATAVVPLSTGGVLVSSIALSERSGADSRLVFETVIEGAWIALLAPERPQLHLGSFLIAVGVTGGAVWLLVRRVPFEALLADRQAYRRRMAVLAAVRAVTLAALALIPFAVGVELLLSPAKLEAAIGAPVYGLVQAVTTAGWLRVVLLGSGVIAGGWTAVSVLLDSAYTERSTGWLIPVAVGLAFTLLAATFSEPVFDRIVDGTASQLPPKLATELLDASGTVGSVYGETPVVVFLAGLFVGVATLIGLSLRLAVRFGYLAGEGVGFSIAAAGLFLAAVSAAVISAPSWLVLGGIAASLAVRDIGQFGTRAGRELGAGPVRQLVAVRAGATLLVGAAGVLFAAGLQSAGGLPATTLALVSLVTALLAFAVALR